MIANSLSLILYPVRAGALLHQDRRRRVLSGGVGGDCVRGGDQVLRCIHVIIDLVRLSLNILIFPIQEAQAFGAAGSPRHGFPAERGLRQLLRLR